MEGSWCQIRLICCCKQHLVHQPAAYHEQKQGTQSPVQAGAAAVADPKAQGESSSPKDG